MKWREHLFRVHSSLRRTPESHFLSLAGGPPEKSGIPAFAGMTASSMAPKFKRSHPWPLAALAATFALCCVPASAAKPRLIVLSDIGNEPDDQMSLVRLLVYSNELDVEGIVATTSVWQRAKVSPEIAQGVIAAYGKIVPNLRLHAQGWPDAADLSARVTKGVAGYGLAALGTAPLSDGATALIAAADRADERPLWVTLWGGANTLAQALVHVRETRSPEALAAFVSKLRVHSISDQDDAGPWIRREFPGLFYIVKPSTPDSAEYASATWTGISGDRFYRNGQGADVTTVTNEWLDAHIRRKGPLGAAYPRYMFIMEGDTPSFLGLVPNGLNAPDMPGWGGWGGRYVLRQPYGETRPIWTQGGDSFRRVTSADTVNGVTSDQATIWRWRGDFQNDFAARMDWTIRPFAAANHPPVAAIAGLPDGDGRIELRLKAGESMQLDAGASHDPDGNMLRYRWISYGEAGFGEQQNMADVTIKGADRARAVITAISPCRGMWIDGFIPCKGSGTAHVILAVTDTGTPALTRYRRIIVTVTP